MDAATNVAPADAVVRIAGLLRSAHPLRIGSAMRRADELLAGVASADRVAVLDRAIRLAMADPAGTDDRSAPANASR